MSIQKGNIVRILPTLTQTLTDLGYNNPHAYDSYIGTVQEVTGLLTGEDEENYAIIDSLVKIPVVCCEIDEKCDDDHRETTRSIYDKGRCDDDHWRGDFEQLETGL